MKSPELHARLGDLLAGMLEQLSDRGPDSAGVAFYLEPAPTGSSKLSVYSAAADPRWNALGAELERAFGSASPPALFASQRLLSS